MAGSVPLGCGRCFNCRTKRARLWAWRQYFESLVHEHSCFVTLTYDDEHIPEYGELEPDVLRLWLKRLRRDIEPYKIRYFLVGEYGERTQRPHYHLSLFGLSGHCVVGGKCFPDIIQRTWGRGFVYVAEFNERTAHYVTGYVVKKLADDAKGQRYLVPEFARFSLKPGLGHGAMSLVAQSLLGNDVLRERDVPSELRVDGRRRQLGRYLLNALRDASGFAPDYTKKFRDYITLEKSLEMCRLYQDSPDVQTFKAAYLAATETPRKSQQARAEIYSKKGNLS